VALDRGGILRTACAARGRLRRGVHHGALLGLLVHSSQRDGGTVEYRVEHPRWNVWTASGHTAVGDFERFYGAEFGEALAASPSSAFVADGSAVVVRRGACLRRAG
jgi:hypothetical protein